MEIHKYLSLPIVRMLKKNKEYKNISRMNWAGFQHINTYSQHIQFSSKCWRIDVSKQISDNNKKINSIMRYFESLYSVSAKRKRAYFLVITWQQKSSVSITHTRGECGWQAGGQIGREQSVPALASHIRSMNDKYWNMLYDHCTNIFFFKKKSMQLSVWLWYDYMYSLAHRCWKT